jgi:thioredoxin 1
MSPIIKEFASQYGDKIKVIKVDIDKNPTASSVYKIISIPTLILFHHGEVKWRQSGVIPLTVLKKSLEGLI